jgi:hypothetical protein
VSDPNNSITDVAVYRLINLVKFVNEHGVRESDETRLVFQWLEESSIQIVPTNDLGAELWLTLNGT